MFDEWCDRQLQQRRRYDKICCTLSQFVFFFLFAQREIATFQWFPTSSYFYALFSVVYLSFSLCPLLVVARASVHYPQTKFLTSLLNFLMIFVWHACTMWFYYFVHDSSKSRLVGASGTNVTHCVYMSWDLEFMYGTECMSFPVKTKKKRTRWIFINKRILIVIIVIVIRSALSCTSYEHKWKHKTKTTM